MVIENGTIRKLGWVFYSHSIVTMALPLSFLRYSEIPVESCEFFIPLALVAPVRGPRRNIAIAFGTAKASGLATRL